MRPLLLIYGKAKSLLINNLGSINQFTVSSMILKISTWWAFLVHIFIKDIWLLNLKTLLQLILEVFNARVTSFKISVKWYSKDFHLSNHSNYLLRHNQDKNHPHPLMKFQNQDFEIWGSKRPMISHLHLILAQSRLKCLHLNLSFWPPRKLHVKNQTNDNLNLCFQLKQNEIYSLFLRGLFIT